MSEARLYIYAATLTWVVTFFIVLGTSTPSAPQ